jgi:small subunit ribosomal protein S20
VAIRHKSAQKAHRQNLVRREANRQVRSRLRTALKDIRSAIDAGDQKRARAALNETVSLIDKMAGKGIIHVNAAGRYKSRIAKRLKTASA